MVAVNLAFSTPKTSYLSCVVVLAFTTKFLADAARMPMVADIFAVLTFFASSKSSRVLIRARFGFALLDAGSTGLLLVAKSLIESAIDAIRSFGDVVIAVSAKFFTLFPDTVLAWSLVVASLDSVRPAWLADWLLL